MLQSIATQGRPGITIAQVEVAKAGNRSKGRSRRKSGEGGASVRRNDSGAQSRRSPKKRSLLSLRWIVRIIVVLLVLVCIAPFALMLVYKIPSIQPVSMLMISKWISGEPVKRDWVSLDDISPFVYQSVISSEDGQFCAHNGVDWEAVDLVVDDLIDGERPRGASTIPMQTVKNLFLWNSRSYLRKALEVPLALAADAAWNKRRMMEIYLNIAEWGPGIFGIEAAAQHHFKKSAKKLTRGQAAMLAVTLPNPIVRNPRKPNRGLRRLANLVEKRARQSGAYIKCLR